jgi:hypothetical protein
MTFDEWCDTIDIDKYIDDCHYHGNVWDLLEKCWNTATAEQALDNMAENALELGLDYK